MDTMIDNIPTHDFRFAELTDGRNVLLNKREDNVIDVVLVGKAVKQDERVLLTMTGEHEIDTAWRIASISTNHDSARNLTSYHCVMTFEGTVTP